MRSHPYTPPPPLPPLFDDLADELSSILPNQDARPRRRSSVPDIPLSELDPDTSRLLSPAPTARQRHSHHHVRVQGRLALVRSVSTANLRSPTAGSTSAAAGSVPPVPRYESAVGSAVSSSGKRRGRGRRRQRRSLEDDFRDGGTDTESEDEERKRETVMRDTQLRGYGIGGVGNIRRPIDVVHFSPSSSNRVTSLLLLSSVGPSSPTSLTSPDKRKWNLREMFGLDRRGKGRASS